MNTRVWLLAGSLIAAGLVGCERAEDANANRGGVPRNNQQGTDRPGAATPTPTPSTPAPRQNDVNTVMHEQALTAWRGQIIELRKKVDGLKARVDGYPGQDKVQIQDQYHTLQTQVASLDERINSFRQTGTVEFDAFRSDIETQMSRANNQYRDLEQKLNQAGDQPQQPQTPPDQPQTPPEQPPTPPEEPMPEPPATPPDQPDNPPTGPQ
jgi:hypothetical protein